MEQGRFRWLSWSSLSLVITGLGLSSYLTITHYTDKVTLACPDTGVINCAKVTTSSYAYIFGIPMAVLGLAFFIGMLPFFLPRVWQSKNSLIRLARLVGSGSGVLMVFWLIYAEVFQLNSICLYCTAVHIVTVLLFGVTVYGTILTLPDPE